MRRCCASPLRPPPSSGSRRCFTSTRNSGRPPPPTLHRPCPFSARSHLKSAPLRSKYSTILEICAERASRGCRSSQYRLSEPASDATSSELSVYTLDVRLPPGVSSSASGPRAAMPPSSRSAQQHRLRMWYSRPRSDVSAASDASDSGRLASAQPHRKGEAGSSARSSPSSRLRSEPAVAVDSAESSSGARRGVRASRARSYARRHTPHSRSRASPSSAAEPSCSPSSSSERSDASRRHHQHR
ncbi:hypothetical protein O3G_MSEX012696 [Manduca sexta]|uniref:Uncharacterized protein n=1 Tax=Manduca sexta TaxID=7130 RepID=A0A922CX08_MANSE|nr:hypothetical protein O3G_MSEX012696 [Manduca sexta]